MADIVAAPRPGLRADEGNIVAQLLGMALEAVQHIGKIFMGQSASGAIIEDDPQIVGAAGFQGTGSRIGGIAQGRCRLLNAQGSFRADVGRSIKRFADCRNGNAAFLCQHF